MQADHASGERRPVTALFVDVVGSTAMAERVDPEDWAATMERAMAVMSAAIERYEGWIATHTGDGFMALFGLPIAHEDDAARAVRAGLEMVAAIGAISEELRSDEAEFEVRVGINSGEVVARDTGGPGDARIYGDTLNVAARVQAEASPGGVLVTGDTQRRVRGLFETRYLGPVSVKGKAEPVEVHEILGTTTLLRSERGIAGLTSPMVGRDAELQQLVEALTPVRAGVGRAAWVGGEPGIGKSRLIRELHDAAADRGFEWVEAGTVSYGRNLPLHLAVDLVRALCDLPEPIESIPGHEARARLAARASELLGADAAEVVPIVVHLLGLPPEPSDAELVAHMEPQTLRLRYGQAIASLLAARAARTPLVVVCDDVHWADEASVELLVPVATTIRTLPVLWVVASRPERDVAGYRFHAAAEEAFGDALLELRLRPLAEADGSRLVAHLLEIESLPAPTRSTILERSEGNPFFVEEIIRSLIDEGAIAPSGDRWVATARVADAHIPETLHGLLLARIDRLPAEARHVLRVASVIGRRFTLDVLERVTVRPGSEAATALGPQLTLLEGAGLVTLAATTPELEYAFRHTLISDAAYESLLRQQRQALHADVAEALLELYPERRDDLAPVLAYHFERADDRERALAQLIVAAHGAQARFARHEALDFARRALALLPADDDITPDARRRRADLRFLAARSGLESVPLRENLAVLDGVIADAEAIDDAALGARAWLQVAHSRGLSGEQYRSSPELMTALDRATSLAASSGSEVLRTRALLARGQVQWAASEFPEAIESMEPAIVALAEAGQYFEASAAAWQLGTAYGHVGEFEKAVAWTDRSHELGLESGDPNATLDADLGRAMVEALRGDTATAIGYASKAAGVAAKVDNKACALVAHSIIGEQHLREGDPGQAAIAFETSADLATFCQFMPVKIEQTELLLQTARARSGVGSVEFERYEQALALARQFGDRLAEAQLYEQRAGDRLAAGQVDAVGDDLDLALSLFERLGARADTERIRGLQASLPA
jgi:class 3 adenylate cyclase/tetratricopeptide (TPR) repeat protein